jgi:pantetheine-phosphate adenylyltransferase
MMPKENHSFISSSTVREVASLGGDVSDFVPPPVLRAIQLWQREQGCRE